MDKTITIYGKVHQSKDGRSFVAFTTRDLDGNYYDVKFTKDCLTRPNEAKAYDLVVDGSTIWAKANPKGAKLNPLLFIKEVKSITLHEIEAKQELNF